MTVRRAKGFDLPDMRSYGLVPIGELGEVGEAEQELIRRCVRRMAQRWAREHRRTQQRRRFNELLVCSVLGVADQNEESELLWRMWLRPQRGHFSGR